MMNTVNFENLISISAIASVLIIASGFVTLAKEYPPQFVSPQSFVQAQSASAPIPAAMQAKVQGYVMPGVAAENGSIANSTIEQSGTKQNFLEKLPRPRAELLVRRFDQAASLLHAGQFEYAIKALDQVISIQPNMPEAYVNLGYAYLGIDDFVTAVNAFSKAIDLRPNQINAYYGLAEAFEGVEDYAAALGAMRSYIHLSPKNDPYVTKAHAAVWELETKLGRKPSIENEQRVIEFDENRFSSPHNSRAASPRATQSASQNAMQQNTTQGSEPHNPHN